MFPDMLTHWSDHYLYVLIFGARSNSGRLMLMDSESQPPPAKRIRDDDYLSATSLIVSPTSIDEFNFPAVQSVRQL